MNQRSGALSAVALIVALPTSAIAQSVNGSADWGYTRSSYRTDTSTTENGSFTQGYTVGYASSLWDPRFALYSGELTFNRNALTFNSQKSRSQETGFNAAASLFSSRPFRVTVHANRSGGAESANYPESALMRAGVALPTGSAPELSTGRSDYGASWVLTGTSLPRVEVSYQQGSATVAAGPLEAAQSERSIHALISREGAHLGQTLRYQSHTADNELSAAYQQRYDDLGYELMARKNDRLRADFRAGRRTTASRFQAPLDVAGDLYRPPASGDVELYYAAATLTHQPNTHFSTDTNLNYSSERSANAGTGALLATTTARVLPFAGLTLRASGIYGQRRQEIAGTRAAALTRAVGGGADYLVRRGPVHAAAGYEGERGWNTDDRQVDGRSRSWRARADAGLDIGSIVQTSVGHDRERSMDQLLTLGNQSQDRTHATARAMVTTRVIVDATYEQAIVDRGIAPLLFRMRYEQAMATAMVRLTRERRAGFVAGSFMNRSSAANERNRYAGLTFNGPIVGGLRLSLTARREHAMSDVTALDQDGYYTVGTLEYRLRLFTFALEHRYTDLQLTTARRGDPLTFTGNQILLRIGRKFGMTR